MRFNSFLLLIVAALLATTVAKDTGKLVKDRDLQRRTGEDNKDKNSSSVAAGFPFPSKPFFSKDETSSSAKDQPTSTSGVSKDDKTAVLSDKAQIPTFPPSKDDKVSSVPSKDQYTITPTVVKEKDSLSTSVTSNEVKFTSIPDKDKTSSSVQAKDDKSTSVDALKAFFNYLATKDKGNKPTSTLLQNATSTSVETGIDKITSVPGKDRSSGPPVIVYSVTVPAASVPSSNSSKALLVAPSNLPISGVTFPGYKIVPSPTEGLLKDIKSDTSISIIPVWTPALLGNAYGGGVIPTPSIYVVRQSLPNGPPTGVPPGYGGSSPQTISPISYLIPLSQGINGTFVPKGLSLETKKSVPAFSLHSTLGTGQVRSEATSFPVHYITKTILTTTTYCRMTTISGKPFTLSSTTLTKTFPTVTVVAVTVGTPTEAGAKSTVPHTVVSGKAPNHSSAPIITGDLAASTPKASSKKNASSGKLPPIPSKEAGISQGRFTNTSVESSATGSQIVGIPSAAFTSTTERSFTIARTPTANAIAAPLISELSSLLASSGSHAPTISAVPVSLVSELLSAFGSSGARTPIAITLQVSPVPVSPSPLGATKSEAEVIPTIPASLVSELSSLVNSPGTKTQSAALVPAALVSKAASILIGSGLLTLTAPSRFPTPASGAGTVKPGPGSFTTASVPSGVLGRSSVNGTKSTAGSLFGVGPAVEIAASASNTPIALGGSLTVGSSIATFATPPAGLEIPAEGPGSSFVRSPQGSAALSQGSEAGTPIASGVFSPVSGASVPPARTPLASTKGSQSGGPSLGEALTNSLSGAIPIPKQTQLSFANSGNAVSGGLQGISTTAQGFPSIVAASANSPTASSTEVLESTGPSESVVGVSANLKPETPKGGPGFAGTTPLSLSASKIPQEETSSTVGTPFSAANESKLGSGSVVTAGAPASQPGATSAATPAVLPATPEVAVTSSFQALASPGSIPEQSSSAPEVGSVTHLPVAISPGSLPKQPPAGASSLSGENLPTPPVGPFSEATGAASGSNLSAAVLPTPPLEQVSVASEAASGSVLLVGTSPTSLSEQSSAAIEIPGGSGLPAEILPTTAPETSSEASGAGNSSAVPESSILVTPTTPSLALEGTGILSSVLPTPIVPPNGGSPAGPIISTGMQASLSTGINSSGNSRGNGSVSVLLNPTAISPFLGTGAKVPSSLGLGISALLGVFFL